MSFYKEALMKHLSKLKGSKHGQVMAHPNEDPENKMHDQAPEVKGHEMGDGQVVAPSTVEEDMEHEEGEEKGMMEHEDEAQDIELIKKILGESKLAQKGMDLGVAKQESKEKHGKLFAKKMKV
jgi:hypothetical protein